VNILGRGISVDGPSANLYDCSYYVSSGRHVCRRVGLSGELNPVNRVESAYSKQKNFGLLRYFVLKYTMNAENTSIRIGSQNRDVA
jgi:hypothetical protein